MKTLKINGSEKEFPGGIPETLAELLKKLNVKAETVVAEIDGQIIERDNFKTTKLTEGQKIELIRFVPGG